MNRLRSEFRDSRESFTVELKELLQSETSPNWWPASPVPSVERWRPEQWIGTREKPKCESADDFELRHDQETNN